MSDSPPTTAGVRVPPDSLRLLLRLVLRLRGLIKGPPTADEVEAYKTVNAVLQAHDDARAAQTPTEGDGTDGR